MGGGGGRETESVERKKKRGWEGGWGRPLVCIIRTRSYSVSYPPASHVSSTTTCFFLLQFLAPSTL